MRLLPLLTVAFALVATRPAPADAQRPALRVLVYHDMEGLAGQDDWHTFDFDFPEAYAKGRRLLVADLNAVIAGLYDGGATQVDVVDAHGSGNPEPDVPPGALDPRARQVFRDTRFRQYVDLVTPDAYDAIVCVGMHAKTGSRGFASHTFAPGLEFLVNGASITETELIGYSWGRVGVPVVLVTGDDRLRQDLRATMPWLEYVTVKTSTSASTAELRPVDEVHREMRRSAARALKGMRGMKAMPLAGPIRGGMRAVAPASFAMLRGLPGVAFAGDTVVFEASDFAALYDGWMALDNVASASYGAVLRETVRAEPNADSLLVRYNERLTGRWLDVESGRWTAPAPTPPPARFFGAR
ncbi:MAG TPA: M55 family metallopeptidase [Gemmatimonadales bacterium]|nr:M55 family metallopeptidase [Gemmatimonadales bacterium]